MRYKLILLGSLVSVCANANVVQYLTGISYSNPAELFKVKESTFILGGTGFQTKGRFNGTQFNFNRFDYDSGISKTNTYSLLPYGRIAKRINQKWVIGVDVTQPFHSNLNWGNNSVTRYAATQTYLTDIDVSPRLSMAINQQWFVGAGVNFNFLKNNETNWVLPSGPSSYAPFINRTTGFGVGYNLGLYHVFNQQNFLGLTYYSKIDQDTSGTSRFQNNASTQLTFNFDMPATAVLNYVHIFNEKWLTSISLFHTEWSANQFAIFRNTSAQPPLDDDFIFEMRFRRSFALLGALRHQATKNLGLTLVGMIDDGPERDELRTLNFPADKQYFVGLSADYHVNPKTTVEFLLGYGFSNTQMNNFVQLGPQKVPFTTGKVNMRANVADLKIKIEV